MSRVLPALLLALLAALPAHAGGFGGFGFGNAQGNGPSGLAPAQGLVGGVPGPAQGAHLSLDQLPLALLLDASDADTLTITSGNVTAWRDKAQGLTFTVPSGANAPAAGSVTVDGVTYTVPEFDAANTEALEVAAAVVTEGPFTAWVVFASTSDSTVQTPFAVSDVDASNNYYEATIWGNVANDPVVWNVNAAGTISQAIVTPGYTTTETFILRVTELGTSRSLALDGGSASSATATRSLSGLDTTSVGRRASSSPTNYHDGRVMAVAVVRGTITTETRDAVEDLLWRTWIHDPGVGIPATGLVLDLDPSDASTLTITSSPDVDEIANRANKGIAALTQATAANKPHLDELNGLGALLFDNAASQWLSGSAVFTASPFTWLSVVSPDEDTTILSPWSVGKSGANTDLWALSFRGDLANNPVLFIEFGGGVQATPGGGGGFTVGATHVVTCREASSGHNAWIDGTPGASVATHQTPTGVDATFLGIRPNLIQPFSGRAGRQLVYKRALSATERQSAERTLMARWGVE